MLKLVNINVRGILRNLNLSVAKGESILIIGSNGSGKTTLFNTIIGAIKQDSGEIFLDNTEITNIPQYERTKKIACVLQDPKNGTLENMTILENLQLACRKNKGLNLGMPKRKIAEFQDKLRMFQIGLENKLFDYPKNLSGGQRQVLSLAMATITDYDVLLLDEITAALDPKASDLVMNITQDFLQKEGKTCLMISHNTKYFNNFGDRTLRLHNGMLN